MIKGLVPKSEWFEKKMGGGMMLWIMSGTFKMEHTFNYGTLALPKIKKVDCSYN